MRVQLEERTSIFWSKEVKALLLLPTGFHVVIYGVGSNWNSKKSKVLTSQMHGLYCV